MSKYLGNGCGKPLNGNEEHPNWNCGDGLEIDRDEEGNVFSEYYYCEDCFEIFKDKLKEKK